MRKKYIICLNNSTIAQQKSFLDYLNSKKYNWWHWLSNTWLVIDESGSSSASQFRDIARHFFGEGNNIVIEINRNGDTWAGLGPSSQDKDMFKWLNDSWTN